MNDKKRFWLIFTICLFYSIVFNFINIYLVKSNPTSTYHMADNNITLWSPDNEYYLDPVDNYMAGNGWRRNPPLGKGSYYRRTPGYSLLYLTASKLTGNNKTYKFCLLIFFQFVLFSLSLHCIWKILNILTNSKIVKYIIVLLFGISPVLNSALFLTITEALFPHLIIYFIYWVLKAYYFSNTNKQLILNYTVASFFITLSILTRPVTGILIFCLVLPYCVYMLKNRIGYQILIFNSISITFPILLLIGSWAIRNYLVTGHIVLLEVAFHPESHDRMKPEFKGLFSFVKSWGEDGAVMNEWQWPLYSNAFTKNDTSIVYVKKAIDTFPKYVVEYFGQQRLQKVLLQYQKTVHSQKIYYDQNIPMPSKYSSLQLNTEKKFNELTCELAKKFHVQYYVIGPFKYLTRSIFHSNTSSIYMFQEPYRQYKILVIVRLSLLLLNVLAYISIIYNIWSFRLDPVRLSIFCIVPMAYVAFFAFYFKEIEQRYLLPALILALIGMYNPIASIETLLRNKRFSK